MQWTITGAPGLYTPLVSPFQCSAGRVCGLLLSLGLAGCDLGAVVSDLVTGGTATHLAAVTVLQVPPIPGQNATPVTAVRLFFGTRPVGDVGFHSLNSATVTIADSASDAVATADGVGNGLYTSNSTSGGVGYDIGATYTFTMNYKGESFVAAGMAPPPEEVATFDEPVTVAVGQPYTLMRSAPLDASGTRPIAFVTVASVTNAQHPTWTNAPSNATGLLRLAIDDTLWRSSSVEIPGTAFPTAGSYVLTLTAVERGSVTERKLFSGSTVLIGSGVTGLAVAQ
jgi:hypothetical protein